MDNEKEISLDDLADVELPPEPEEAFAKEQDFRQKQQMVLESLCIQGQLEGLYRQLYQACTQQMMTPQFVKYAGMMKAAELLFKRLNSLVMSFEKMEQEINGQDKPMN